MKWIKASERLPDKKGVYVVRCLVAAITGGQAYFTGEKFEYIVPDAEIEWLDESPTPPEGKGYSLQQVADTWDAANDYAKEREDYRYGKRGPFQYPNKETFIASLPPQPVNNQK